MVAVAAVCLMAAFAAPTAGAAAGNNAKASASAAKAQKNAKKAKARAAVTKKRLHLKIRNNRKYIRGTRKLMRRLGGRLRDAISGGDKSIDDKINGIVAVVTPVLQQLGEGVIALRDGSLALKAGLEQLAAATRAGFDDVKAGFDDVAAGFDQVEGALTDIGDYLGATENGFVHVALADDALGGDADSDPDPIPGCFYESADIPDTAQGLILNGQCRIPTTVAPATQLHLLTGIRSGENDGQNNDSDDAVGEAGIVWYEQRDETGNLDGGGATQPTGAGLPPAVPIPNASELTPEGVPFPFSIVPTDEPIDLFADTAGAVFAGNPDPPVVAGNNQVVEFTVRFTDLSATDEDPEA